MPAHDALLPALRLHQLEGFYYVATHGGFTRAAEAMPYPITEPALHQQVRKLERTLGVPLLERAAKRRMVPTAAGRALYRFVAPYFEELPRLLRELVDGEGGALVVGAEPLYCEGLCAGALAALQRTAPRAQVRLLELDLAPIADGLARGQLDLGIASEAGALPSGVRFEPLGLLGLELLVPADHPLARRRAAPSAAALSGERFVVYAPDSAGRAYTDRVLRATHLTLAVAAEASSAQAMRALVGAGVGLAFVPALRPRRGRRRTLPDGTVAFDLSPLVEQVVELPRFGLLRRASALRTGLAARFATLLAEQV